MTAISPDDPCVHAAYAEKRHWDIRFQAGGPRPIRLDTPHPSDGPDWDMTNLKIMASALEAAERAAWQPINDDARSGDWVLIQHPGCLPHVARWSEGLGVWRTAHETTLVVLTGARWRRVQIYRPETQS